MKRAAPKHIAETAAEYRLARHAWEIQLETATCGYFGSDEERDYRESNPPPMFRDYLAQTYANMRAMAELEQGRN